MKRMFVGLLLSGFFLFSCSKLPDSPVDRSDPGSANITVKVGKVGVLGKIRNIELSKLYISLTAPDETPIYDTIDLSGNGQQTISKTYSGLASLLKTWTLHAESRDVQNTIIHSGDTSFTVQPRQDIPIPLTLDAKYSMLKANFFPIRDSVTRCELLVDGNKVDDSSFAKQSLLGDTITLSYNYLKTGISQRVKLDVYGTMWGFDTLLYTGDTAITPLPGMNASYAVTLRWVGPGPMTGGGSMTVVLGAVGTVTINGSMGNQTPFIEIDARELTPSFFWLDGVTPWLSRDTVRSLNLLPGNYLVMHPGGNVMFQVVAPDSVTYDPQLEGFLTGRGTNKLVVHGMAITIDPRELSATDYSITGGVTDILSKDMIITLRILPGSYTFGSSSLDFNFLAAIPGVASFDHSLDAIISGNGTNYITILPQSPPTVTDIDGNVYHTVTIGTQVWMVENLKTTKYNDGTAIPLVTDNAAWATLTTPGYCWYNNDAANYKNPYGALYNWYTVNTGNLAPTGWHVATDAEWTTLTTYLGSESVAGGKLKDLAHWFIPNTGATNETGFSALPGGEREFSGSFYIFGSHGWWWSSTAFDAYGSWFRAMYNGDATVYRGYYLNNYGFSVRCVRD